MAVALRDFRFAVNGGDARARLQIRAIGAKAHCAAEIAGLLAPLELVAAQPLGHQSDHRLGRRAEFGRIGFSQPGQRTAGLDDRHLHAEADAEVGHLALARETRRQDLALRAARPEAARDQDAVHALEVVRGIGALENLALDPVELDAHLVGHPAVGQRLDQRLIGVLEPGVFAHDRDRHLALGIVIGLGDVVPAAHVGLGRGLDAEGGQHLAVEAGGVIERRHVVDRTGVARFDNRALAHVAKEAKLAPLLARNLAIAAAEQDVRLDADRAQFLDRVLRRLGLELARRRDEGQEREVDGDDKPSRQVIAELPDRLEERQALDVADRAADLDQDEIHALVALEDEFLDRVGDMRDHLHRRAEEIAAPLLGDQLLIDAPGRDVVLPVGVAAGEALVMAEVEVGLGAVVGDEHLAMLGRAHRAGIDVEIRVELAQADGIAARHEQRAKRRRGQTFAK